MPLQNGPARDPEQSYAERWAAELFLNEASEGRESVVHSAYQSYTPFREEQELEEAYGPQTEEEVHTAELENEEYHEAFDEAVAEASELDEHRLSEGYDRALNIQSELVDSADREQQIETAEPEQSYEDRYLAPEMFVEQTFYEPEEAETFADEEEELGYAHEVLSGLDRAVRQNRHYSEVLGWGVQYGTIARLLGFIDFSPDEKTFAEAIARWQRSQGLRGDGIVGPETWARLRAVLAADDRGRSPGGSRPTSFRPTPVESPGGGRIKDKKEPNQADLVTVTGFGGKRIELHRYAAEAWRMLVSAARKDGLRDPLLLPISGYRGVKHQERLWEQALKKHGSPEEARKWVAPPGGSPHQTGRAIDFYLGGKNSSGNVANLRMLPAYRWLVANAARFGFYPYEREPWHWEYNPPAGSSEQDRESRTEPEVGEPNEAVEQYQEWPARAEEHSVAHLAGETRLQQQAYFDSFVREAKALLDKAAEEVERRDLAGMSEAEIEATLDRHQPLEALLPQGLGDYLRSIRDTAKGVLTKLQAASGGQPVPSTRGTDPPIDVERAVNANQRYGAQLGWQAHFDRIVRFLGFTSYTPDERGFAAAIARWQRDQGLEIDGIIGPRTWERMRATLALGQTSPAPTPGPAIPAGAALSSAQIRSVAQSQWDSHPAIQHHFKNKQFDRYLELWPLYYARGIQNPAQYFADNIVTVSFFGHQSPAHRDMVAPLRAAENALRSRGITPAISSFWSFTPRPIRGTTLSLSKHATGRAVDINPEGNPLIADQDDIRVIQAVTGVDLGRKQPADVMREASQQFHRTFNKKWIDDRRQGNQGDAQLMQSIKRRRRILDGYARTGFFNLEQPLIDALVRAGFEWGGNWEPRKDFMHFELRGW